VSTVRLTSVSLALLSGVASPLFGAVSARDAHPIRLRLNFVQSNLVTTITVGDRTVQASVDTGGGAITLSKEILQSAGARSLGDTVVSTDSFGHESRHARFRVPVMTIGGETFRNMTVIQASDTGGPPIPNGIGRQFLSRYFVVLDYERGSMTLWPPSAERQERMNCGPSRIPMDHTEDDEQLVVSTFDTGSGPIRLLWDTGANISMLPETIVEKLRLATYTSGNTTFYHAKMLSAGGNDFGPIEFVVAPLKLPGDFEGMLGRNFVEAHVVCLDYKHREVRVH
jgi:Aspartyl protease